MPLGKHRTKKTSAWKTGRQPSANVGCLRERISESADLRIVEFALGLRIHLHLFLNRFVDFLSVNGHILGRFDAESNFVSSDVNHHQCNLVTNDNLFVLLAAKYKHGQSLQCKSQDTGLLDTKL